MSSYSREDSDVDQTEPAPGVPATTVETTYDLVEISKGLVQPIITVGGFVAVTVLAFQGGLPADDYLQFFLVFAGVYAGARTVKGTVPRKA